MPSYKGVTGLGKKVMSEKTKQKLREFYSASFDRFSKFYSNKLSWMWSQIIYSELEEEKEYTLSFSQKLSGSSSVKTTNSGSGSSFLGFSLKFRYKYSSRTGKAQYWWNSMAIDHKICVISNSIPETRNNTTKTNQWLKIVPNIFSKLFSIVPSGFALNSNFS